MSFLNLLRNATEGFTANMAVRFTKEGDGHMNRLTQKVQAGKLCDMETAPKFISCGKLSILCTKKKAFHNFEKS